MKFSHGVQLHRSSEEIEKLLLELEAALREGDLSYILQPKLLQDILLDRIKLEYLVEVFLGSKFRS